MQDLTDLARAERADLADLLQGLTPQQWEAPSLCAGWRVRDVVAHLLSYEELDAVGLARRLAHGRLLLSGSNAVGLAQFAARSQTGTAAADWRSGDPARPCSLAMAGRRGITPELSGDGQPVLARRVGA